jgi:ABC-type multidrug transport system ATPase subunit
MKQVMADLALTQVANRAVGDLTQSEYRRLMIGVQLVRDPGTNKWHILLLE